MIYYRHKGNHRSGYPQMTKLQPFIGQAVTIGSSGGYFFFPSKDCIAQSDKGANEDTKLKKVRVCNIHWYHPPFFRLEGCSSDKQRVSRL